MNVSSMEGSSFMEEKEKQFYHFLKNLLDNRGRGQCNL